MNIQISVTLWTLICFAVFYVILRFLLLDPVMVLLDKRRAKVQGNKQEIAVRQKAREDEAARLAAEREEQLAQTQAEIKAEAENKRLEGKKRLEEAKKERAAAMKQLAREQETTISADLDAIQGNIQTAATVFLSNLFADE